MYTYIHYMPVFFSTSYIIFTSSFLTSPFFIFFSSPADNKFSNIHHLAGDGMGLREMTMVEYLWYILRMLLEKRTN